MKNAFGRKPSASMVVAVAALVMSGTGTAIAAASLMNGDQLIAKRSLSGNRLRSHTLTGTQINVQTLGKVPLAGQADRAASAQTAFHAVSADSATNSTNATNADNAAQLGGQPASAFQLTGGRGVALAGGHVTDGGQVTGTYYGWFNTLGGQPTISHAAGTGLYYITIPGIGDMSHYVIHANLQGGPGEIGTGTAGGGAEAGVFTYNSSGSSVDSAFNFTIYGASNSG